MHTCEGLGAGGGGGFWGKLNWLLPRVSYGSGSVNRALSYIFLATQHLQGRYEFPHCEKGANWRSEKLDNLSKVRNTTEWSELQGPWCENWLWPINSVGAWPIICAHSKSCFCPCCDTPSPNPRTSHSHIIIILSGVINCFQAVLLQSSCPVLNRFPQTNGNYGKKWTKEQTHLYICIVSLRWRCVQSANQGSRAHYPAGEMKPHTEPVQYIKYDVVLLSSRRNGKDRKAL